MKKRILAIILAVITVFGMFAAPVSAASTLEEAMAEVDIYARNTDLNWLTMNGSIKTQWYTYYNYSPPQGGESREIPAYCTDPRLYGVPAKVEEGTGIKYSASSTVTDPKVCGIISNGYPHMDLATLGLQSKEEAYYATKTALWIYLLGNWTISGLGVNPELTGADKAAAERVLAATKAIYTRGMAWTQLYSPKLTATADKNNAYPATVNGQSCYQQIFTIDSDTWALTPVALSLEEGAPSGTKLLDMDNNEISTIKLATERTGGAGYQAKVKVVYPASSVEGQTGTAQLVLNTTAVEYKIFYAKTLEADRYGNIQSYMLDTDPSTPVSATAISSFSAEPDTVPPTTEPGETALKIVKLEAGTNTPLAGAVFKVLYPDGSVLGSFSTGTDGTVTIPVNVVGNYSATELTAPAFHLLPENPTQNVTVVLNETATVTFYNKPYGNLRVEKYSDTGEPLAGVTVQVKHLGNGTTLNGQTGPGGAVEFSQLEPGGVEVRELTGIEGWQADTETVKTATIVSGETSTVVFTNKELPGIRIIKYDRTTLRTLPDVTFEVFQDGTSLGQYKTDELGEVLLTNLLGTIRVVELQSDDAHITAFNEQEIELKAGDGIRPLVFFNDRKPGLHLVKVDSSNLSLPIPNAKFKFTAVDGSWGPQELTTGLDGSIDLSALPAVAMQVQELSCPGYIPDDAIRVIQLKPNEDLEFVFTNSKLPSIHLIKLDWKGDPLPGVTFRLSKIADGTNYLDRTTNENGEILWEALDCSADEDTVYSLKELSTVTTHILDPREYHIQVFPGKTSTKVLQNDRRSTLYIHKTDADTGEPIEGAVFLVKSADGHSIAEAETNAQGIATVENLLPQVIEVVEKSVPSLYLLDAPSQLATLYPNRDRDVYFENHKKPNITVRKLNAITDEPLENGKFSVQYASNSTSTGELHDLGTYYTGETGEFSLPSQYDGWYKISELLPPTGYALSEPSVQEFYLAAGTSKVVTFKDMPLSAIVVYKYDTVTGKPLSNCLFELRYFSGPTNTSGTVIATGRTGSAGTYTFTGLEKGTYQVFELASDGEHLASTEPQTAYISGEDQDIVPLFFGNVPYGSVLVTKVDNKTGAPLSDVEFQVSTSDGTLINGGKYVTDRSGSFLVSNQVPGTSVVVKEKRVKDNSYILDDTAQIAVVQPGRTVPLEFRNSQKGTLIINKLSTTGEPLEGVKFSLRYANGAYVDDAGGAISSNGRYFTDKAGQIVITNIIGTVVATEEETISGYTIDENTRTQTVVINPYDTQKLFFYNAPIGGVLITKVNADRESERIPNTTFEIHRLDHGVVGEVTTGDNGTVFQPLEDGGYYAVETKAGKNFALDSTPHYFAVKDGQITPLKVKNKAYSGIEIHKIDAVTGEGVYDAKFLLYDGGKNPVAEAVSDQDGYARFENLTLTGRVYLKELECEGYQVDTQLKTVTLTAGKTTRIEWKNTPITGQIQIYKYAAEYNTVTGTLPGAPIQGAVYEIIDVRTGKVVDQIVTDARGVAASKPLPLKRYQAKEVSAPMYWRLSDQVFDLTLEFAGQIIKVTDYDKPSQLGVALTKTGIREVLAGNKMSYTFTVANTSNVALDSFYFHDKIPYDVTSVSAITTGTYNQRLTYRVLYKTNVNEYRVLASNLLTTNNYAFQVSGLPLMAGEVVTDIYYDFGTVPVGFQCVAKPTLTVSVSPVTVNGYQVINRADAGGKYGGTWQSANAAWITIVRNLTPVKKIPLPKTGY